MRFFTNNLPDYKLGDAVVIPEDALRQRVTAIIDAVVQSVQHRNARTCKGGLYVGSAGIAYALWYVASTGQFPKSNLRFLSLSKQYLDATVKYYETTKSEVSSGPAFLLGPAGVYAVGALYYGTSEGSTDALAQFLEKYGSMAQVCSQQHFLRDGSDELLVGRAGYLCGVQLLSQKLCKQVLSAECLHSLCRTVVESGRQYARRHNSPLPLMYAYYDTEYLGPAHGLSGILQILLGFPDFIKSDPAIEKDVRDSVDFLMRCQTTDGNFAPALDEVNRPVRSTAEELVHWCHGAPGVVYLFAKAYLTWKDAVYLSVCVKCAELVWTKGLLKKGPGICHGVAGNGYVFLLLYRLTQDKKYLHRALQFAAFLEDERFKREASTPDSPYSLYEGLAGTACFLTDLLQPEKAEFPFFNVF